jgi:hypothetical protein
MKKYTTLNFTGDVYMIHSDLASGNSKEEIENIPYRHIRIVLDYSVQWLNILAHREAMGTPMTANEKENYNKMVSFYDGSYIPPAGQVHTEWFPPADGKPPRTVKKTFDGVQTLKAGYEEVKGVGTWLDG